MMTMAMMKMNVMKMVDNYDIDDWDDGIVSWCFDYGFCQTIPWSWWYDHNHSDAQDTPAKAEIPMINVPGQRFTATHGIKAKKGEQKLFLWVGKLNLVEKIADDDA